MSSTGEPTRYRVLLIGSGGREHALANALLKSPALSELFVAPGNAGTSEFNVALDTNRSDLVASWCDDNDIDLVVVGPEAPLVNGIADELNRAGVRCFGPSAAAARLEGSKSFTREFAQRFEVPSPRFACFDSSEAALGWLDEIDFDVVVKADGLAAGKGVLVPTDRTETTRAVKDMLDHASLGDAGSSVVLEERLEGEEVSVFAISDGVNVAFLGTAQDHKRVGEGDTGPNTGGWVRSRPCRQ